ncbi:MAG: hypothetical protein WD795_18125 [Woeseia sp.]
MKKRGRKSAASLAIVPPLKGSGPRLSPPASLDEAAASLWRAIVETYPSDHFTAGDLVLLREFCFTSETLLPAANSAAESGGMHEHSIRVMHVKTVAMLASKLRLNVSARTRTDTAKTRDAARPAPNIDFKAALEKRRHDND